MHGEEKMAGVEKFGQSEAQPKKMGKSGEVIRRSRLVLREKS